MNVVQMPSRKPRPFAWSFSRLKNFDTCPKRSYELDIAKTTKEVETDEQRWGHAVHSALDARCLKGTKLPDNMMGYEKWAVMVDNWVHAGWRVRTEQKLAFTKTFQKTGYFDDDTWCRVVVDCLLVKGNMALALDWKTGKIVHDSVQLGLTSQAIFAHHPEVVSIKTVYVWLGDNKITDAFYHRADMVPLWNGVLPQVAVMENASINMNYPPKPGGLCKRYCPVVSCPYHGKGSY